MKFACYLAYFLVWRSKIKTLQTVPFLLFSILWYFRLVAWAAVTASAELAARLVRPPRPRKDAPQIGLTSTASKTMAAENSRNLIWFDTNTYSLAYHGWSFSCFN